MTEELQPQILEECCGVTLNWKPLEKISIEGDISKCVECETSYIKKSDTRQIYFSKPGENLRHLNCGELVEIVETVHSIHGKDMYEGWGQTVRGKTAYCPKCELRPSSDGKPAISRGPFLGVRD